MLKVSTPNGPSDDTHSETTHESKVRSPQAPAGASAAATQPAGEEVQQLQHADKPDAGRLDSAGGDASNRRTISAAKTVEDPLFDGSESGSLSSEPKGPLIASVRANGEPEPNEREQSELTESEEALIARQTDMIAPKAPVPELKSLVREPSDAAGSHTLPSISDDSTRSSSSTIPHRDSSSSVQTDQESRRSSGDVPAGGRRSSDSSSPGPRSNSRKSPILGPMEPMEPMEPAGVNSELKKLPPLNAGFPTVPGFPTGDPGANTVLPGSHDANAKRVHNLPSLVEEARNMAAAESSRGVTSQFGPGHTNFMAEMYTQPSGESPYLHGLTTRTDRAGNPSTASRLSSWGYDDGSLGSVASHAVSYASPSQRNRDPRFSYTYPHGMLSGPAGIVPENMDNMAPLRPHYNHMGPPPPLMAMAPTGVPYQPGRAAVSVVPQGPPPPAQHQHSQQPLTSSHYPVMIGAQQVYSPHLPSPHYVGGATDGMDPMQQQRGPPVPLVPVSRETSVAPAPPSQEGTAAGSATWGSGSRQQQNAPPATSESRVYRCTHPGCEWSFVRSSDQKRHIRSHEKPSLQCPYWEIHSNCNRKGGLFYRLDVLKRHLRLVHLIRPANGADDGGSCRVCGQVFEHTRDFINHCTSCAEDAKEKMLAEGNQPDAS